MSKKTVVSIIILVLALLMIPANAASSDRSSIEVTKLVVEPSGPDLNITMYYNTSLFNKVFSLIFGAKVIQPSLENVFSNFDNVSLISIDSSNCIARFTLKDQCKLTNNGWYVYPGNETLTIGAEEIEIRGTMRDKPIVVKDTKELPMFSYRVE